MKIIFLNIWNSRLKDPVIKFIKEHVDDTDVFCFQEAYDETINLMNSTLLKEFKLIKYFKHLDQNNTETSDETYEDEFPQATYIKSTCETISDDLILKETPATGLGLHTQINYKGSNISICNVHGISKPGNKLDTPDRLIQSQQIIEYYKNYDHPVIIGGDFNLEMPTQSVELFEMSGYRNLITEFKIKTTRNRIIWEKYPNSIQYFSDYVFVNNKVNVKSLTVPNIEISDHLPMILEIELSCL